MKLIILGEMEFIYSPHNKTGRR